MTREEQKKYNHKYYLENKNKVNECCAKRRDKINEYSRKYYSQKKQELAELKQENNKLLDVINNQDVKIADLEKQIADLERENHLLGERCNQLLKDKSNLTDELKEWKDEWQEQVQKAIDEGYARTQQTIQLTKAKEIIKKILYEYQRLCLIKKETIAEVEQFLKEIEK